MHTAHRFEPRYQAAYSLAEAAQYLRIPLRTLRSWVASPSAAAPASTPHLLLPAAAAGAPQLWSFINLLEAHVLYSLRMRYRLAGATITRAWQYLATHFPSLHPLADYDLWTDGRQLFCEDDGRLITLNADGQLAMRAILPLRHVERTLEGVPVRLVPRPLLLPTPTVTVPLLSCRVPGQSLGIVGSGFITAVV